MDKKQTSELKRLLAQATKPAKPEAKLPKPVKVKPVAVEPTPEEIAAAVEQREVALASRDTQRADSLVSFTLTATTMKEAIKQAVDCILLNANIFITDTAKRYEFESAYKSDVVSILSGFAKDTKEDAGLKARKRSGENLLNALKREILVRNIKFNFATSQSKAATDKAAQRGKQPLAGILPVAEHPQDGVKEAAGCSEMTEPLYGVVIHVETWQKDTAVAFAGVRSMVQAVLKPSQLAQFDSAYLAFMVTIKNIK